MMMLILSLVICYTSAVAPSETVKAKWNFHACLNKDNFDFSNVNDSCSEPEWITEPITISFSKISSIGKIIDLDLTGIDSDSRLNYDSPALKIEIEGSTGTLTPLTYFTMRPDSGYGSEFEPLEEFEHTRFCGVPTKTSWAFDRAVPEDLDTSVTIVLSITGNEKCSWMEIIMDLLKEYWYFAIAGGVLFLATCCCWIWCCGCRCCSCDTLLACIDCCGCLECLDCCGCFGCCCELGAEKVLEMV